MTDGIDTSVEGVSGAAEAQESATAATGSLGLRVDHWRRDGAGAVAASRLGLPRAAVAAGLLVVLHGLGGLAGGRLVDGHLTGRVLAARRRVLGAGAGVEVLRVGRVQQRVGAGERVGAGVALAIYETGDAKSSADAAGAARQYSGSTGGVALCQVMVTLTYATSLGHTLLGRAPYLPDDRASDEEHRELTGIPDGAVVNLPVEAIESNSAASTLQ